MSQSYGEPPRLVPALLKYWRGRRGMSQLDLSLAADVSSRHVSFLETGRARPSREMLLRLASALDVPLRQRNNLLRSAGFEPQFDETPLDVLDHPGVRHALDLMLRQHEPFPMVVMDRVYRASMMNGGARALVAWLTDVPGDVGAPFNGIHAFFDPRGLRPSLVSWESTARRLLTRVQLEALRSPEDERLSGLVDELLAYPDVPEAWKVPDFESPPELVMTIGFQRAERGLSFASAVTSFSAPQSVALDEIRIESYFPLDEATASACRELAKS